MEFQVHYDNLEQRKLLVAEYEEQGYRMLHDNFDSGWQKGDEPHGTLIFTDQSEEQVIPIDVFERLNPTMGVADRLVHIEDFLEEIY